MSLTYGDLVVYEKWPELVYLLCRVTDDCTPDADKDRTVALVKFNKRDGAINMTSLRKDSAWKTLKAVEEHGFKKIGHIDLSELQRRRKRR